MTIPNLNGKKWICYGLQGSGKTFFVQHQVVNRHFPNRTMVITPQPYEWRDESTKCFFIQCKTKEEIEEVLPKLKSKAQKGLIKCLIIDEVDHYYRNNHDIGQNLNEFILEHRHIGNLSMGFLTRRPQDMPHIVVGSCFAHFVFSLEDPYALDMFKQFHPEMPDMIRGLTYGKNNFVIKEIGKDPFVHDAISS